MRSKYAISVGERWGMLTVLEKVAATRAGAPRWRCRCDCGNETVAINNELGNGHTQSCGCWGRRVATSHGHSRPASPTYRTWSSMIQRTTNPNNPRYADYGGRGITVCDAWRKFEGFLADMGERPKGRTLDRIDNDRGYESGNCRWSTPKEQQNNRRVSKAA